MKIEMIKVFTANISQIIGIVIQRYHRVGYI